MIAISCVAAVALVAVQDPGAPPQPPKGRDAAKGIRGPVENYESLVQEYRRIAEERGTIGGDKEAWAAFQARHPAPIEQEVAGRFVRIARDRPGDPIAFDALLWAAVFAFQCEASEEAAALLARDHSRDPRLWAAIVEMQRGPIHPGWGILLRAIHQDSPDRIIQGRAGLALAEYLVDQAEFVRLARIPGPGPYQAVFYPPGRMERFRKLDPEEMDAEAELCCGRILAHYADIRPTTRIAGTFLGFDARSIYKVAQDKPSEKGTLGDGARALLDRLRGAEVGKPAPAIEGADDRGGRMALAEFRGQVVALSFGGDWCGACVAMQPDERSLVSRYEGRPFALLGVNSDWSVANHRKAIDSGAITWRCWPEPRSEEAGPIVHAYRVRAWPTVFVIDAKGIIRARTTGTRGPDGGMVIGLDALIEDLVREAEAAGGR